MENLNNQQNEVQDNQATPESVNDNQDTSKDLGNESVKQERMFTESEVNALISKRLKREKEKQEKALKEAERLSKMSEDERAKEELDIERKKIAEERAELDRYKLLQQTQIELSNREIPREFAEWIVANDAESTLERINSLKKLWDDALDNGITTKLAGRAPKIQSDDQKADTRISKSEFKKLSLVEQQKIFVEEPELYKKLTEK